MDFDRYDRIRPIRWNGSRLTLLDQRRLPFAVEFIDCADSHSVSSAIRDFRDADVAAMDTIAAAAFAQYEHDFPDWPAPPNVRTARQ